jgi:hypothetical protein
MLGTLPLATGPLPSQEREIRFLVQNPKGNDDAIAKDEKNRRNNKRQEALHTPFQHGKVARGDYHEANTEDYEIFPSEREFFLF